MSAMEKINGVLGKLPFVKLAEKIPVGARAKFPLLETLIPHANQIASIAAALIIMANIASCGGGGGGLANTTWKTDVIKGVAGMDTITLKFSASEFILEMGTLIIGEGTYKVSGNTITTYTEDGSKGLTFTLRENTITDSQGTKLIKQ
jgi:hypothetical protein